MNRRITLNGNDWLLKGFIGEDWILRQSHMPDSGDRRGWKPALVPGSVTHDLWQQGQIPDPYFERNSLLIEWAPERTWVYKKSFTLGEEHQGKRISLHFEGVDYSARFYLNGECLGERASMYTPAIFDVGDRLKYGEENLLAVVIFPAPQEQPQVGRTSQVHTHKSRMTFWWDFCPRMIHQGIWDGVFLEISGPVKIEDVFVRPQLSHDFSQAEVTVSTQLSSLQPEEIEYEVALRYDGQVVAAHRSQHHVQPGLSRFEAVLEIPNPQLWWPNGHGEQPLYEAQVCVTRLADGERTSDERRIVFGIRRIEFVPNDTPDNTARPYTLVVNGKRIYIKGWNWVPIDVFYGLERPDKLKRLLTLARRAHVNLLRVWGGGLIEKKDFYDSCDRMGILVWQEFIQSSSGIDNYPSSNPDFVQFMAAEARQIIPRRRNHPSLAIWCGGNELQLGTDQPLDEKHPLLKALQSVVQELDPDRYWLPTSPSGPRFGNSFENIAGDPFSLHDVHGPWEHQGVLNQFELYNRGACLLHSEFGVEGITNLNTLKRVIAGERMWPVSLDNLAWFHLGAWWVKEAAWRAAFGEIPDIEAMVRAIQFWQADGLRYAVEADRRRQYRNSGTLPWQFNEPYPMAACTSAVDYYAQPKPAYFAVAHAYEPVHISALFSRQAWAKKRSFEVEAWVSNSLERDFSNAKLEMRLVGAGGYGYVVQRLAVPVAADASAKVAALSFPFNELREDIFFLDLRLSHPSAGLLSQNRYVFSRTHNLEPLLRIPPTSLSVEREVLGDEWRLTLANTGDQVALYVWLIDPRDPGTADYFTVDQNHFCLFPHESRSITVGWDGTPPAERSLALGGWNTATLTIGQ